jgi:hypothetical protein
MHAAFAGSMGGMPGPFGPSGPMPMGPQPGFRGFGAFEKPFPVVRLRGLPFNAGELDIFEFFQARSSVARATRAACACGGRAAGAGADKLRASPVVVGAAFCWAACRPPRAP